MAGREVKIAILGDSRDFKRAVASADRDASKLSGALTNVGGSVARMSKALAVGAAAGAVAVGAFAVSAIGAASDLAETVSKSNTVFKENAKEVEKWADGAAKSFGQSKKQALESASSFGNMFLQLGIGGKQAVKMSKAMTELASDFASFHNADITEVLVAQQAAFRGEYDAVQRFVPTINAAAVEQKALALKLAKTTKELTPQHKALATEALLLEGAGDAMGDFARTSDGLANKQRILTARFEDVKAKIGTGLMPVALALATFVEEKLIPLFEKAAPVFEGIGTAFSDAAAVVGAFVSEKLEALSGWWDEHGENIKTIAGEMWDTFLTAIKDVADWLDDNLLPALGKVATWVADNEPVLKGLAITVGGTVATAFLAWAGAAIAAAAATWLAMIPVVLLIGLYAVLVLGTQALIDKYTKSGGLQAALQWFIDRGGEVLGFFRGVRDLVLDIIDAVGRLTDKLGPLKGALGFLGGGTGFLGSIGGGLNPLGLAGKGLGSLGSLFSPKPVAARPTKGVIARAHGGSVFSGSPYMVGERGPELFMPGRSGTVIPNNRMGGGGGMVINITMPPGSDGKDVVEQIRRYERSNGTSWRN